MRGLRRSTGVPQVSRAFLPRRQLDARGHIASKSSPSRTNRVRALRIGNPRARKMTFAPIHCSTAITDFLNRALADGALAVGELEAKARAAGLIGERQQIRHAKAFKKAKKALGIRSVRDGFGSGGKWAWLMPPRATQMTTGSTANSELDSKRQHSAFAPAPPTTLAHGSETCSVVQQWADGIERLDYARSPAAVPLIRWHGRQ
jgi:hypothetical protein